MKEDEGFSGITCQENVTVTYCLEVPKAIYCIKLRIALSLSNNFKCSKLVHENSYNDNL